MTLIYEQKLKLHYRLKFVMNSVKLCANKAKIKISFSDIHVPGSVFAHIYCKTIKLSIIKFIRSSNIVKAITQKTAIAS